MDVSRQILDNLMGRDRNKTASEIKMKDHYSNKDVCKPFLICFCFHTLFPNTSYEDGPCKYKHDPYLKNMFDHDMTRTEYEKKYIIECIDWIQRRLSECEVRIKKNKEMIDIKSNNTSERPRQILDRLLEVDAQIQEMIRQAQIFAANGQIFDSERSMNEVERLREKKKEIELMGDSLTTTLKLQKICEVCGAIQVINDTQKRIQTHLEGKIHQGFLKLRHQIQTLKIRLQILNTHDPNNVRDIAVQNKQIEAKRRSRSKSIKRQIEIQKQKQKQKEKERQKQKQKERQRQKEREKEQQRRQPTEREDERYRAQRKREKDEKYDIRDKDKGKKQDKYRSRDEDKTKYRDKSRSREKDKKDRKRDRDEDHKSKRDRSDSRHKKKHSRKDSR